MTTIILFFLAVGLFLYTLLGGADFGAGVLEIFMGKKSEHTISKAIAPVWEANHVWLILVVVIIFNAFPKVYSTLSTSLHIPLLIIMLGIIFRGTAFTFRHYDVDKNSPQRSFTFFFRFSSVITPLFLGITLGAMMLGQVTLDPQVGFWGVFISPWLNWFSFAVGVFSVSLFTYLAAIFFVSEVKDEIRFYYVKAAKRSMFATLLLGILVFIAASIDQLPLLSDFLASPWSIFFMIMATLMIPAILFFINNKKKIALRIAVAAQVACIMLGWGVVQYPVYIFMENGEHLTIANTAAPNVTFYYLLIALLFGSALIFPGIYFLFKVFKSVKD